MGKHKRERSRSREKKKKKKRSRSSSPESRIKKKSVKKIKKKSKKSKDSLPSIDDIISNKLKEKQLAGKGEPSVRFETLNRPDLIFFHSFYYLHSLFFILEQRRFGLQIFSKFLWSLLLVAYY